MPEPELTLFPVLLDLPAPKVRAYRRETVIAEKFHAVVDLGMANSRLKDYFDLSYLAEHFELDALQLSSAITATFSSRGSTVPEAEPLGLSDVFALDTGKAQQWQAFLRRTQPRTPARSLPETILLIRALILPLVERIRTGDTSAAVWRPPAGWTAGS